MKIRIAILSAAIFAGLFVTPVQAVNPIDYCGNPRTGKVISISTGTCDPTLLSLGVGPIVRGATRPKALDPKMKNRYLVAKAAARKNGYTLGITSGWRSLSHQQALFKRAIKRNGSVAAASKWVLPPKKSNHPWGIAIDVNYGKGSRAATKWLERNGYKFGLCRRYKNEWWHFEPLVGPGQNCPAMENYAS